MAFFLEKEASHSLKINPLLLTIHSVYGIINQSAQALFQRAEIFRKRILRRDYQRKKRGCI